MDEIKDLLEDELKESSRFKESDKGKILQEFIELRNSYSSAMKEINTKLEILDDDFHITHQYNPIHHIEYRIKSPKSIVRKAAQIDEKWNLDVIKEKIFDIAGVRVVCNYIGDIYKIEELLLSQNDIELITRKDYIEKPKESGYRSLHIIVTVPVFLASKTVIKPVEIQIRTLGMDLWASLEHDLGYKNNNVANGGQISEELKESALDIARIDKKMESIHNALF